MRITYLLFAIVISSVVFGGNPRKSTSVLASGSWYKIAVQHNGIHQITYDDFIAMGFNPSQLASSSIRVYGNGGGMLPENNASYRYDDLRENAVEVVDGGDGKLDPGDYILFYGESPDKWTFAEVTRIYTHTKHLYSDFTYYFVTISEGSGKRIGIQPSTTVLPTSTVGKFDDRLFHELDSLNLIKSGRNWYGEVFNDKKDHYDFPYYFPGIDTLATVRIVTNVAGRAPVQNKFFLSVNGEVFDSIQVEATDLQSTALFARPKLKVSSLQFKSDSINLTIKYRLPDMNSTGWLDYFELTCSRALIWKAPQMSFRNSGTVGMNRITEFVMTGVTQDVVFWDVTNPDSVKQIEGTLSGETFRFRLLTDTLREFIAFNRTFFYPVTLVEPLANQDLHAVQPHDLVIVTHPLFVEEADSLAEFHRKNSNLSVVVVELPHIYNEFASGKPDLTAIRDFMKMLYDKASPGSKPKYLLLFGDGSYDPKNRVPYNNNMIPTYQSGESLKYVGTFVTDDYYGIMGDNLGDGSNGNIDIGIGRFPVSTKAEASVLLKKIMYYSSTRDSVMSDWRNIITFIADNENRNLHMHQAEQLAEIVKAQYPFYNVNKIYIDSYPFVPTPAGDRCPDANRAITEAVTKGCLILNYTGHGGEGGWAAEKILTSEDIESWENLDNMPVFITATCEFSRFDNPERYTAGEMVLMHPNGGAIALYSTTRLALSTSNFRLDSSVIINLLPLNGEPVPKMGDLIRISKNNNDNNSNIRNFVLLGDPAQNIAHPQYRVTTTEINNQPVGSVADTLLGLTKVDVKGRIEDHLGNKLNEFNGIVYSKVYDKVSTFQTLANQTDSYRENYELQNSILFHGKTTVRDGEFDFSFIVPKNLALNFGNGKISYYAKDSLTDANGYFDDFIIGGVDASVNPLNQGPEISLYLDHPNFISGDKVDNDTELLAYLFDENGINYYGLGIGHEIVAYLDNDVVHPIVLDDYFLTDTDDYRTGMIRYPLIDLDNGRHTLRLKAWDLYNNPSEKEIYFFVSDIPVITVNQVENYPNPFRDMTTFRFNAVEYAGDIEWEIEIFDLTGIKVKTIQTDNPDYESGIVSVHWDGRGDRGQQLSGGLYIYQLTVKDETGAAFRASQKLVIMTP